MRAVQGPGDLVEWIALQHRVIESYPRNYLAFQDLGRVLPDWKTGRRIPQPLTDAEILAMIPPLMADGGPLSSEWLDQVDGLLLDGGAPPEWSTAAAVRAAQSSVRYVWHRLRQVSPGGPEEPDPPESIRDAQRALDRASNWARSHVHRVDAPTDEGEPQLTKEDQRILAYLLREDPGLRSQTDMEAAGIKAVRSTINRSLGRLRAGGLTHRPAGKNKGEGLTPKGREVARRLPNGVSKSNAQLTRN